MARSAPAGRCPVAPARTVVIPQVARPRANAITLSARDDRAAFALLMLPFVLVTLALGSAQMRRAPLPTPDIVLHKPAERMAVPAPAPGLPPVTLPGPVPAYPPPLPQITTASLDVRPPPPVVPQVAIAYPPPSPEIAVAAPPLVLPVAIAYPPPLPEIAVALPPLAPPGVIAFPPPAPDIPLAHVQPLPPIVPTGAITYPPAQPDISLASLDMRPPLTPPAPPPLIETPAPGGGFCSPTPAQLAAFSSTGRLARAPRRARLTGVDAETFGRRLAAAALQQTEDFVVYSARYQAMAYPMGDVMALHGACIDVVIRAYRMLGIDLQEEVQRARGTRGDPNIDHRRTENVRRFLERHGTSLAITAFPEDYKPGDIVTYHRPHSRVSTSHIAIVTDVLAPTGRPMIVHNRGYGAQLEDALFVDRITGHYRYMGPPAGAAAGTRGGAAGDVVRASYRER